MKYVVHRPAAPLDAFVDTFWALSDAPAHSRERIVPAGTFELVVNLDHDEVRVYDDHDSARRFRGAVVSGAYTKSFVVDTREHASLLGVHFRPGAARAFIGVRADELADSHVDLAAIWSPAACDSLRDALCSAPSTAQRFAILEGALRDRLIPSLGDRPCLHMLLSQPRGSVRQAAMDAGRSHRSFIRAFSAEVGMSPKLFLRIRRFHRALALAGARGGLTWAELAIACGYCDQSHFIRDFAEFAGVTPTAYAHLAAVPVKRDHIALD
jgi:AraC-like DNA-binding protein